MNSTKRSLATAVGLAAALLLTGCSGEADPAETPTQTQSASSPTPSPTQSAEATPTPTEDSDAADQSVVGTVVRFTAGDATVDVTIEEDSPATRDLLSRLPMTLDLEEFNGREKVAYLEPALDWEGTAGSDPEDGDLIYYVPWGNIGFYYNTAGIGYSDQTLHLGTYDATEEELSRFEGQQTTVEIVD